MRSGLFTPNFEECLQNLGYKVNWPMRSYARHGGQDIVINISPVSGEKYLMDACWKSPIKSVRDVSVSITASQNAEGFLAVQGGALKKLIEAVNLALNGRLVLTEQGISKDLVGLLHRPDTANF